MIRFHLLERRLYDEFGVVYSRKEDCNGRPIFIDINDDVVQVVINFIRDERANGERPETTKD